VIYAHISASSKRASDIWIERKDRKNRLLLGCINLAAFAAGFGSQQPARVAQAALKIRKASRVWKSQVREACESSLGADDNLFN